VDYYTGCNNNPADFPDILNLLGALQINQSKKGGEVEWLM
jgi:hypothetical protein